MANNREKNIINSSLWASYGDALGFVTELADKRLVRHRANSEEVTETVLWRRNIGGRFGVTVDLPRGCYSDDTQLRLATSRSIRADGYFDVEAFAKIELPVWRSYALGAGRSTKAAASSLAHLDVSWFSNFFRLKDLSYLEAGGNGAAMRIQPHVWANKAARVDIILRDVIRNTVCTHGHPRGIAGACFHALCLHSTICSNKLPGMDHWHSFVSALGDITNVMSQDNELNAFWLPVWEQRSKRPFADAIRHVQLECQKDIELITPDLNRSDPAESYANMVESIGALESSNRGSGIKTAILASALCWLYRDRDPKDALVTAANLLGSDTDTIATMAGAILGVTSASPPEDELLDRAYLVEEAERLYNVSEGNRASSFPYPDLSEWIPPRNMIDVVQLVDDSINIAGLGTADAIGPTWRGRNNEGDIWQWLKLRFGQSVLVKSRAKLTEIKPNRTSRGLATDEKSPSSETIDQLGLFQGRPRDVHKTERLSRVSENTLDSLTAEAIKSGFSYQIIGMHLMRLAEEPEGIELAIAYAAVLAKAKRARLEIQSKKNSGT